MRALFGPTPPDDQLGVRSELKEGSAKRTFNYREVRLVLGMRKLSNRTLHCYAEGRDGEWEAICLDLDIAVQGRSFEEVFASLQEAVALYLETVADLPPEERRPLLHRSAPLSVRLKFLAHAVRGLFSDHDGHSHRHQITMPLAA
jgi:predicted RNase H-like HicB family nuclease